MKVLVDGMTFDTDFVRIELDHGVIVEIQPDTTEIINPNNPSEPDRHHTNELFPMSTIEVRFPYEETPDGFVVRNVKRCPYCEGAVNRFCSKYPDKHFHYSTLYFECASCGSRGDPVVGIMDPPR
jgi:hypothetical protein